MTRACSLTARRECTSRRTPCRASSRSTSCYSTSTSSPCPTFHLACVGSPRSPCPTRFSSPPEGSRSTVSNIHHVRHKTVYKQYINSITTAFKLTCRTAVPCVSSLGSWKRFRQGTQTLLKLWCLENHHCSIEESSVSIEESLKVFIFYRRIFNVYCKNARDEPRHTKHSLLHYHLLQLKDVVRTLRPLVH